MSHSAELAITNAVSEINSYGILVQVTQWPWTSRSAFAALLSLLSLEKSEKKISEFQNSITLGECLIKSILRKAESCLWLNHIHRKTIEDNSTVRQQQTWHLKQRDDKSWSHMASSKQRATVARRAESLTSTCWMLGAAFAAGVDAAYANEV